jgi:5-formyltetrahydrofolate cyclo-ligase
MLKKKARELYREKRNGISYHDRMKWDDLLLIQFQATEIPFLDYMLSFYPIEQNNEVNTFLISDYLHFRNPGLHICYPRTNIATTHMDAVVCSADSIFEANAYNIPEPLDTETAEPALMDLVIVPLLAFDASGNRVGYGKGYYDRFLSLCRKDCLRVGFSYFEPIDSIDDPNEFDVPLDICITPQRTYVF